ncbi:Cytochrome b2 [Paramyrothecium foliicola]|nr:Cytochrome b2 [Paramyrothecium foliicola]
MVNLTDNHGDIIVSNAGNWYKITLADGSELGLGDRYSGGSVSEANGRTLVKIVPAGQGLVFRYQRFDGDDRTGQGWPIGDKGYLRGLQVKSDGTEQIMNMSLSWEPSKLCLYNDNSNYGLLANQLPGNRVALYGYNRRGTVCGLRVTSGRWVVAHESTHALALDCEFITAFVPQHPGGRHILLKYSGNDATTAFDAVHPKEILEEYLKPEQKLGVVDAPKAQQAYAPSSIAPIPGTEIKLPPLASLLSVSDVELLAMQVLSPKAISYYVSASDDEITKAQNNLIYRSILLRPRVFVDCTECFLATTIIGQKVGLPIFVSPAAMARLAHPAGEAGIAAACSKQGALQIISKNASMSPADIVAAGPDAVFAWQLYVLKDISATERTLAQIREIPQIKFIVLTLDAPFPGKREADERFKMAEVAGGAPPQTWGTEGGLTWAETLAWLVQHTSLPIVLKGVQTHEDALIATQYPAVKGIILSNHGGRALDTAPTPIHVLLEIRKYCPEVFQRLDVLVDGGIKRGTDVVKALALGAKGVGIGRAALYGLAVGGQKGVERVLEILSAETATALRLLGVKSTAELDPQHVNARMVSSRI